MRVPFEGGSAGKLLQVADSDARWIEVEITHTEKDAINGFETIDFQFNGQTFKATCDVRYEHWYFLIPRA